MHGSLSNLGSLTIRNAILYLLPNFSNSAMTQSVIYGIHFAYKQSIILRTMSILFLIEKLIKLVSTRTWNGGPSCVLYWKNNALDCCTCSVVFISLGSWKHHNWNFPMVLPATELGIPLSFPSLEELYPFLLILGQKLISFFS